MKRRWECPGCGEPVRGFWESVNHCDPNEIDIDTQPPAPAGAGLAPAEWQPVFDAAANQIARESEARR